jgi:hypothetical protein
MFKTLIVSSSGFFGRRIVRPVRRVLVLVGVALAGLLLAVPALAAGAGT